MRITRREFRELCDKLWEMIQEKQGKRAPSAERELPELTTAGYRQRPVELTGETSPSDALLAKIPARARAVYQTLQQLCGEDGTTSATIADITAVMESRGETYRYGSIGAALSFLTKVGLTETVNRGGNGKANLRQFPQQPARRVVRGMIFFDEVPREEWTLPKLVVKALKEMSAGVRAA